MEYRNLPDGGGKISTIGIGARSLHEAIPQEIKDIISYGMEHGINLMDTVMYDSSAVKSIAQVLRGRLVMRFVILKRSLLFLIACNQVIKCRNCAG
jgi:predicted aldo/keto reductase-like oxidoreductase